MVYNGQVYDRLLVNLGICWPIYTGIWRALYHLSLILAPNSTQLEHNLQHAQHNATTRGFNTSAKSNFAFVKAIATSKLDLISPSGDLHNLSTFAHLIFIMSGSGGYPKFRCKYFQTHGCERWVMCKGTPCPWCVVSLYLAILRNRDLV